MVALLPSNFVNLCSVNLIVQNYYFFVNFVDRDFGKLQGGNSEKCFAVGFGNLIEMIAHRNFQFRRKSQSERKESELAGWNSE